MNESNNPPFDAERGTSSRAPLLFAGLLFLFLAGSYVLTRGGPEDPAGTFTLFLGRFHPVLVHLPIGFLIALGALEVYGMRRPAAKIGAARGLLLGGGCLFSVLSVVVGFCLAREGGYEAELLFWHQWLGVGTAVLALLAAVFQALTSPGAYRVTLAAGILALIWAGHDGASLTHGEDYLTEHLAEEVEGNGDGKIEEYAVEYERDVVPILRAKCIACHGPDKQDGRLRLDVREQILEGGESGRPAVLPGDLSGSYVAEMVTLPRNHKLAMPPMERAPLTRRELQILLHWIYQGAPGLEPELPQEE